MNGRFLVSICFAGTTVFCQAPVNDPVRAVEVAQRVLDAQNRAVAERPHSRDAQLERDRFKDRFNKLISAMQEFTEAYNGSNGEVWPQKSAEAVDKGRFALEVQPQRKLDLTLRSQTNILRYRGRSLTEHAARRG